MKTKRRHELHTNVLADWLGRKMEKIQPFFGWIIAGGIAIILGILAYTFFSGRSEDQVLTGWDSVSKYSGEATAAVGRDETATFQAATKKLGEIAQQFSGTPLATFTEATLGDLHLYRGQTLMWVRRPEALKSLEQAENHYNTAISSTSDPLLKNRLQLTLGTTHEWMFDLDQAKAAYEKVQGIFQPRAQQQLAALNQAIDDKLFNRLERFEPAPPQQPRGQRPDLEFGNEKESIQDQFFKPRDSAAIGDSLNPFPPLGQPTGSHPGDDTKLGPTDGKAEKPADAPAANQPTAASAEKK